MAFQLTQSRKDKLLLAKLRAFFGVGRLHESTAEVFELLIENKSAILNQIIPFLQVINPILFTRKHQDYQDWLKVCEILAKNKDLELEDLVTIVLLANNMNKFRVQEGYEYLPEAYILILKAEHLQRALEIIEAKLEGREPALASIKAYYSALQTKLGVTAVSRQRKVSVKEDKASKASKQ